MKRYVLAAMMAFPAIAAFSQAPVQAAAADSVTTAAATALGKMVRENVDSWKEIGIEVNPEDFCRVFTQSFIGEDTGMTDSEANMFMSALFAKKKEAAAAENAARQQEFVNAAAAAEGAVVTPSGLVFQVITEGEGDTPKADDVAIVNYEGRLSDGTVFDGNIGEEPVEFGVSQLIPGFTEGLMMMKPGGVYRIVIPSSLGYGPQGIPGVIPGGAALDFTIMLQGVKAATE